MAVSACGAAVYLRGLLVTLRSGILLGPYEIVSVVGAGAMGEVYQARDTRLDRRVAIKVLHPATAADQSSRERFEREARAASSLNHPHICTLYDVGRATPSPQPSPPRGEGARSAGEGAVDFLVMEYLEGETLAELIAKGPLSVDQVLRYGIEMTQALEVAHDRQLVHRDLKPSNVMVTSTGTKLLDFGLVKRILPSGADAPADFTLASVDRTTPGMIVGTLSYMSPEQARGLPLDGRTDIFSLGIVLYEMVTGQRPFQGLASADVIAAILNDDPRSPATLVPAVPAKLGRVVLKALAKDRALRYGSARELREALEALRETQRVPASSRTTKATARKAPSAARSGRQRRRRKIDSLAVLPLANVSADSGAEYLSDGITESIINSLSTIPALRVMARSSVFRYKGRTIEPGAVGDELNVRAVLMGRVQQVGANLVIGVELIDVADGSQLWGAQYTRQHADILAVQQEIASEISDTLRLRLSGEQRKRLASCYTPSSEAYQLYLQGRYCLNKRGEDDLKRADGYFRAAVEKDPNYALAWAGLADACALQVGGGTVDFDPQPLISRATSAAARALELDDLAEAHASMAFIKFRIEWDWPAAEREFTRALALNPGRASTRHWYGMFLAAQGRFDAALDEMRRAAELDPMSFVVMAGVAKVLYFARRFDEAIEQDRKIIQLDPTFLNAWFDLGFALLASGAHADALDVFSKIPVFVGRQEPGEPLLIPWFYALVGQMDTARTSLARLHELGSPELTSPVEFAFTHAALNEWDESYKWLKVAFDQRSGLLTYVNVDPITSKVLQNPRNRALIEGAGLVASSVPED